MAVFARTIVTSVVACGLAAALGGCGARKQEQTLARQAMDMRVELAQTYIDKGARQAAIPLLRRALAERPEDVRIRVLYGCVLRDLGLYPQAEQQLQFALARQPDAHAAHAALAILLDLQKQPAQARAHHERAVALAPRHAPYRNNYGFSLYLDGDVDAAIAQYEAALGLDPSLSVGYNNLGFAYGRRGELDKAERSFRTVGTRPAALLNLALVHDERGDAARADALREEAYALAPDLRPSKGDL